MSALAAGAVLMFTVFAARTFQTGHDDSRALRAYERPGRLIGFDAELARRYTTRPLLFFKDAAITNSLVVMRERHMAALVIGRVA